MKKLFKEFTAAQLARLKKEYDPLKGKRIPMNQIEKMQTMLSKYPTDMLVKLANTDIPFIATAAKNIAVVKRGKKWSDFKTKLDMAEADELQCEACWDSHKQVGTKISSKTGKRVPNCVPKEELEEALNKDDEKSVDDVVKQLKKAVKAHQGQVKTLTKDLKDEKDLEEADLSKSQVTKVHKQADDLPKKDFMKRYGKDGDAVRYATATNMVKKKLGINEAKEKEMYYLEFVFDSTKEGIEHAKKGIPDRALAGIEVDDQIKAASMQEAFKYFKQVIMKYANRMKGKLTLKVKFMGTFPRVSAENKKGEILTKQLTKDIERMTSKNEDNKLINKGELKMNESYKLRLNSAMDHYKIESLGDLKDEDQKAFFNYVDGLTEGLTAGQKKLPAGLQKAILAKQGDKKEVKEEDAYDGTPAEVAKMKAKEKADAEKAKSKDEMHDAGKKDKKDDMKTEMMAGKEMNAMKMNAMKMPIRAMMKKKSEDLVGGQKKLDKDKDGDLDAKDFAALRKTKSEAVKTGEADLEPKTKELNAMVKSSHKPDHKGNPVDDMNATYMKSNVKAPVKDNGGTDMSKVKDTPEMMNAMMKISKDKKMTNMKAMYGESREDAKRYLDTKPGSLEEAVLISRGLVQEQRWYVDGKLGYKGISNQDGFEMVINANSESDAEDKAEKALEDARAKRKIGPGGGGRVEDIEIEMVDKTNKPLSAPETYYPGN